MEYKKILKESEQEYEAWFDGGQSIGTFDDLDEATEWLKEATLSALKEDPDLDPADIVSNIYYSYDGTRLSELEPGDEGYDEDYADDDEVESFTGEDFLEDNEQESSKKNYVVWNDETGEIIKSTNDLGTAINDAQEACSKSGFKTAFLVSEAPADVSPNYLFENEVVFGTWDWVSK